MNANFLRLKQKLMTTLNPTQDVNEKPEIYFQGCDTPLDRISSPKSAKLHQRQGQEESKSQRKINLMKPSNSKEQQLFGDQYIAIDVLGEGVQSLVKKCYLKDSKDKNTYAVKIFRRADDEEVVHSLKQSFLNASSLEHPFIIKHHKLFLNKNQGSAQMVMEYSDLPSLDQLIRSKYNFTEHNMRLIFKSLFQALQYLHYKGLCHRDIKPDNILVDVKSNTVKLIDFGVARRFLQTEPGSGKFRIITMMTQTGNINFCAPEIFWTTGYKAGVDMWAAGVVMFLTFCGSLPFKNEQIMDQINEIKDRSTYQFNKIANFNKLSKPLQDLLKRLLHSDPQKRLQPSGTLRHPWFYSKEDNPKVQRTLRSKDDLFLGNVKEIEKSDTMIKQKLTKSDRMKLNSLEIGIQQKLQFIIDEVDELKYSEPSLDNKFVDRLIQFKTNTIIENVFLTDSQKSFLKIDFVESIHSSSGNSVHFVQGQGTHGIDDINFMLQNVDKVISSTYTGDLQLDDINGNQENREQLKKSQSSENLNVFKQPDIEPKCVSASKSKESLFLFDQLQLEENNEKI